ncbi:response regulator [Xanthobacteraceae bacterium A53D]
MQREQGSLCLVVEDDQLIMMVTADLLEYEGFRVVCASNAEEAIHMLESGAEVQMMITDVNMPGSMDGLDLAALVSIQWPSVGIVVTSGQARPSTAQLPRLARFLAKPYSNNDLIAVLRSFRIRPERLN